jgi:hypothetical protein
MSGILSGTRLIARIAWFIPVLLLALSLYEIDVARDLKATTESGQKVWADVTRYERSDRKDVTNVELDLDVHLPDGSLLRKEHMTLPYSIGHRVDKDSLEVFVLPGADQDVVIASISGTATSIAWSNAAMSFIAFLIAVAGVWSWNRFLARRRSESSDPTG